VPCAMTCARCGAARCVCVCVCVWLRSTGSYVCLWLLLSLSHTCVRWLFFSLTPPPPSPRRQVPEYLIKWKGLPLEQATWERGNGIDPMFFRSHKVPPPRECMNMSCVCVWVRVGACGSVACSVFVRRVFSIACHYFHASPVTCLRSIRCFLCRCPIHADV
jgi:hypothetical protein